jgi:hypothetical protein
MPENSSQKIESGAINMLARVRKTHQQGARALAQIQT